MSRSRTAPAAAAAACIAALLSLATPAKGQWYVTGGWGVSDDLDAAASRSVQSLQLGLQGFTDVGRLLVTGGLPVRSGEDLTWAAVEGATSPLLGRNDGRGAGFQPDILGRGFLYDDPSTETNGAGGLLLVEPYAVYGTDDLRLRGGGGLRAVASRVGDASSGRTAGVAAGDLLAAPAAGLSLRARGEVLFFESTSLPNVELGLFYDVGFGALWAGADRWAGEEFAETGWYVGGALDLTEALSARLTVGRSSGDPLFGTPPRDTWSISVRYRFADRPGSAVAPAVPEYAAARGVDLRVPVEASPAGLSVAGSFNGWRPEPMVRRGDDWTLQLDLPAGYHELAFVDDAGRWFVPEGLSGRRPDGMGGWVLVIVVR